MMVIKTSEEFLKNEINVNSPTEYRWNKILWVLRINTILSGFGP